MAINELLPSAQADTTQVATPQRTGRYGEAYVINIANDHEAAAMEGCYYMALTPTPGTGIIGTVNIAAITAVSPTMLIYNGHTTKTLYPKFLNLHETVVSTSGARVQFTFYTDPINRYTSSGTALTISNTSSNTSAPAATGVVGYVGTAMVATAASVNQKLVDHVVFAGGIDIVENQYEFIFGGVGAGHGSNAAVVTTVQHYSKICPPIGIAPGGSFLMHQWAGSQANAPTYEYRFGFKLR
jgi:hypothetical protein